MNPVWEQQRTRDPPHLSTVNTSMGRASSSSGGGEPDSHCQYTRFIGDEARVKFGMEAEREPLSPPLHNWSSDESAAADADGKSLPMEDEDPELVRKRKELEAIEEKIMFKKAAIALKTVNPFAKTMPLPGFSFDEQSAERNATTLRDRVNAILHQQHPPTSLRSKVQSRSSRRDRRKSSCPVQADHPLKVRVNSLLRRRCRDPHVVPAVSEVFDVLPPLRPSQSYITPSEEENGVNKGFLRFLSVLNEGVDLNVLSRIVNDDRDVLASRDEMLNPEVSVVETNSDVAFTKTCQTTGSGAPRSNWASSGERTMVSQERSHNDRCSPPTEDKTTERGGHSLATRSQSKSPPAEVKKKEDEKKAKAQKDEQQEQLQNILKTLGFSLEADEMSRLADRTQERLYGKKPSGNQGPDCQDQDSQRCSGHSSSSTSSPSKSICSSSRLPGNSHKVAQTSHKGSDEDKEESQRHQMDPYEAQPTASSQDSIVVQLSQHTPHHNGVHGNPAHYNSAYAQGQSLPSKPSLIGFTYPQHTPQHFPLPVAQPHEPTELSHMHSKWAHLNPDLSMSEGQTGLIKGPRCLTYVEVCQKKIKTTNVQRGKKQMQSKNTSNPRVAKKVGHPRGTKKVGKPRGTKKVGKPRGTKKVGNPTVTKNSNPRVRKKVGELLVF